MPLNYPDILQHNNSVYPIVDSNNILGSVFVTGSDGEQYGISEYKRKLGMIVYFSSSQDFKYYKGGTTASGDWGTSGNWSALGGGTFTSYNFTASFNNQSTWTVNHNLGYRYVIIQTFDTSGNQILPSEITLTNTNTATATFPEATSGTAVVTFGGATFNNPQLPSNPVNSIQYNNGGIFSGSSNFTFNGSSLTLKDTTGGFTAFNTSNANYTFTELLQYRDITTQYQSNLLTNKVLAGDIISGSISGASVYDLLYLESDGIWYPVVQTNNTKATQLLGIYSGQNRALIEGYIIVGNNSGTPTGVPKITGSLSPGRPVYIADSATSSPFLSTTAPTTVGGIARILGHLIKQSGDYWLMRFRPDHTWVEIS